MQEFVGLLVYLVTGMQRVLQLAQLGFILLPCDFLGLLDLVEHNLVSFLCHFADLDVEVAVLSGEFGVIELVLMVVLL